jgi:hypothetical protein
MRIFLGTMPRAMHWVALMPDQTGTHHREGADHAEPHTRHHNHDRHERTDRGAGAK